MKNLKLFRYVFLLTGTIIAWHAVISSFQRFYAAEGTIFKIKDCVIPNPITTPCFWGALAFVFGAIWAYKAIRKDVNEKKFLYFLIFSVLFAWTNFVIEAKGIQAPKGSLVSPCPATTDSPYTSPCFFGSILFTLSAISSCFVFYKNK